MKDKFKSFFGAAGYLLLAFLIQVIVSVVVGGTIGVIYTINNINEITANGPNIEDMTNSILGLTNYILLASSIITVLTFLLIYKVRKKSTKKELQIVKTKNINLIIAGVLGVCVWLFNSGVLSLIEEAGLLTKYFDVMNQILSPLAEGSIIISIITVGIVAPFAEEFLFRGVIYKTLNKNISITWTIIIQAVLFGLFHGNLIQGSYATLLGLIFGYVTYKTKSLWPAIIMHMVNNTIATILPMFLSESIMVTGTFIGFMIFGIIGIVISLLLIKKKNNDDESEEFSFINYNN